MIPTPSHLVTNLAYKLKPHQTRNQYLRARMVTYTDVNIMPASVHKLVFNDLELKKLAHSDLEIGTYTTDTCEVCRILSIYLVHPDTKNLKEVTLYVAKMMVVSFCPVLQHLHLDLYNLAQDLIIYLPEPDWLQAHWTTQRRLRESWYTD